MAEIVEQNTIYVWVSFKHGKPVLEYQRQNGKKAEEPLLVSPGSRVGWIVLQKGKQVHLRPAYRIDLPSADFLGVQSIDVPRGGNSGYLPVLEWERGKRAKYTLTIPSLGIVDDPEMQVETNERLRRDALQEILETPQREPFNYTIIAEQNGNTWDFKYTVNRDPAKQALPNPFPLNSKDTVVFAFEGDNAGDFGVQFTRSPSPPTPFEGTTNPMVELNTEYTVRRVEEYDNRFPFVYTDGDQVTSPRNVIEVGQD